METLLGPARSTISSGPDAVTLKDHQKHEKEREEREEREERCQRDRKQLGGVIISKIVSHRTKSEKASCVRMGKKMSIFESLRAVGLIGAAAENCSGSCMAPGPPRARQPWRCRSGTVGGFQARARAVRVLGWFKGLLMTQLGTRLVAGTRCPGRRNALALRAKASLML